MKHLNRVLFSFSFVLLVCAFLFPSRAFAQCGGVSKQVFIETFGQASNSNAPTYPYPFGPPLAPDNGSSANLLAGETNYIYWDPNHNSGHSEVDDNFYTIVPDANNSHPAFLSIKDHTGNANGNMFVVNADYTAGTFYKRRVRNLCQNTYLTFSAWFVQVDAPITFGNSYCGNNANHEPIPSNVLFSIYDTLGHLIDSVSTGNIHAKADGSQTWQQYLTHFYSGKTTAVDLVLSNINTGGCGNDLAIDDIELDACQPTLTALPPTGAICVKNTVTFTSSINSGYNPPLYQWYSSKDNGVTWNPLAGNDSLSTYSIPSVQLSDNGTQFRVKAAGSLADLLSANSCSVTSNPVTLTVSQDNVTFGPIPSVCQSGGLVDLTKWVNLPGGSFSGNGVTGTNFDPTKVLQGSVTQLTYSYVNPITTCQTDRTTNITVIAAPAPTIFLPNGNSTCAGKTVEMDLQNVNAGDNIQWFDPTGTAIGGATGIIYKAPASGKYTVTVTNLGGCVGTASQTVTVNALPGSSITQGTSGKICAGGSVKLTTATAGTAYQWTLNHKKIISKVNTVTVNASGVYTLAVQNASGCSDSASYVLTVNALPVPTITYNGATTFCPGSNIELDAGGNLASFKTLQWLNNGTPIAGATGKYYVATAAGNYTLNVTDANGCLGTAGPVTVTLLPVPAQPTIAASGPLNICQGAGTLTLSVTNFNAAYTYQWVLNGNVLPGSNSATYTVQVSGTYTVRATNASHCAIESSGLTATVSPTPVVSVGFTTLSVCTNGNAAHDQVTLTTQVNPAGAYTFQWYFNGSPSGAPTSATTFSATATGQYYFTATSAAGCTGTAQPVNVVISPQPNPVIQPATNYTANFCMPTPGYTYLQLAPGTTYNSYQWYLNGSPIAGATNNVLKVTAGGNYNLQVVNGAGCSGLSSPFTVSAFPAPNALINPAGPIQLCQGSPATLTANQSGSLQWWNSGKQIAATTTSIQVYSPGDYYYTFTDANGCTATSNIVQVGVHKNPPANLYALSSAGPIKICTNNSVKLHMYDVYPTDSATFEWHLVAGGVDNIVQAASLNDSTYTVPNVPSAQGDYWVKVSYTPSGCNTLSNTIHVQFNQPPIATLSGNIICGSGPVYLSSPPGVTFAWEYSVSDSPFTWAPAPGPTATQTKYAATMPGFYHVSVSDGTCANYSDTIKLTAGQPIAVTVSPVNQTICKGSFIQLTATVTSAPLDPSGTFYNYQWFHGGVPEPGGAFNSIGADKNGIWSVIVTRKGYCTGTDQTNLTVNTAPKPVLSPAPSVQVCEGSTQTLTVTNAAQFTSYTWLRYGVPITGSIGVASPSYVVSQFGDYSVIGTALNGCVDTSLATTVTFQKLPQPVIYTTGPTIFCDGATTHIYADSTTASGKPTTDTFQWSLSATGVAGSFTNIAGATSAGLTISQPGYYQVTETTTAGCAGSTTIFIQTFPVTNPVISGPLFFCDSSSTTLTSNIVTPGAFEWDYQVLGGFISDQPSITITSPGVYILVSRNLANKNCYKTTTVTVTKKPLPVVGYIMADSCQTTNTVTFIDSSRISDNSALTYAWNFGDVASGASNTATTPDGVHTYPAPVVPTTYPVTLTVTSPSGCAHTYKQQFLFRGSKPVAGFTVVGGGAGKICAGQPVTLQDASTIASGTIKTYAWALYDAAGKQLAVLPDSLAASTIILPDTSADVKYTIIHTVIGSSGCLDITSQTVTASGSLKATLKLKTTQACLTTAPDSLRGGLPVNGSGGGTGAYSGTGVKAGIFYPLVAGVGKHAITYTFVNPLTGCSSVAVDTLTVQAAPAVAALSAPATYKACDTSVLLTASGTGAVLYEWFYTLPSGSDSLLHTGTDDTLRIFRGGNYRARVANKFGCYNDATLFLTLNAHPHPGFDLKSICSNLVATFDNTSTISDKTPLSYLWNFGDPASGVNNTTTSPVPVHQFSSTGTKTVTLTVTSSKGCVQSLAQKIAISNIDSLVNFHIQSNMPYCANEPVVFVDSTVLAGTQITGYQWIFLDASGNVLSLPQQGAGTGLVSVQFPAVTTPTTFTVREVVMTTGGCPLQGADRTLVIYPPTPVTYVRERGRDVCRLDPPFLLTGGSTVPPGQPGKGYYAGNGVPDSMSFNPRNVVAGDNRVTYLFTNQYGCTTTASTVYTVFDTLVLSPRVTNFNVLEGDQVTLNGIGTLPFTFGPSGITSINADSLKWAWTPGTGLSSTTVPVPTLTAGVTTSYLLTVTPPFGCPSRAVFAVVVHKRLKIPNAFSPNGDGMNDTWILQGIDNYPNVEVFIFNRWGEQLWHSKGYGTPWNGYYNGKPLPMGTYYYLIKLNKTGFMQPLSGPLTLIY